ncbi:OmpA family protein [Catenovulum sp. SM1970]|uniref:OmpA family protein n=1 Tax=Marinifaba aquimaris TaxID=2741323 RepID=UPI0015722A20|nr:OmpA family protein [Marinifaba aquimaris]NTS76194.1 OmpA family protein [Marinifaba aquimaris]
MFSFRQNKIALAVSGLLLTSMTHSAFANNCDMTVTADCPAFDQWFIGGQLGKSETDIGRSDVNNILNGSTINGNDVNLDDSDTSVSLFGGYRFNPYFSLELGYQDLGDRDVSYTGTETNLFDYYDNAARLHPDSGDGIKVAAVISWPINPEWTLSGRLGLFKWEQEYTGVNSNNIIAKREDDGTDPMFGLEVGYHLRRDIQLYAAYDMIEFDHDDVTNLGLGIRYFFGSSDPKPATTSAPKPAPKAEPAKATAVAAPTDSDKDGVFDQDDQCINTPMAHRVDAQGCSVYKNEMLSLDIEVLFANDSAAIPDDEDERADIAQLAEFMKAHPKSEVTIAGHTSAQGAEAYNMKLSQRRADAVAKVLTQEYGIDASRIEAKGYGETRLLDKANTREAHKKNRRITAHIDTHERKVVER